MPDNSERVRLGGESTVLSLKVLRGTEHGTATVGKRARIVTSSQLWANAVSKRRRWQELAR